MDPVQALIIKLMEGRAAQDRTAQQPLPDPGNSSQAPLDDFSAYASHLGQTPSQSPDDLIAQLLGGGSPPQR
jgi:hypothetical protein